MIMHTLNGHTDMFIRVNHLPFHFGTRDISKQTYGDRLSCGNSSYEKIFIHLEFLTVRGDRLKGELN